MSKYEERLKEICSLAVSQLVKDRKKCNLLLNELCENKEATEELDANSKNENETGVTWTKIIKSFHKLLLKELARKTSENYSQTMLKAIKKANSSKVLVKCEDLVELVIDIISNQDYMEYHKSYLTILVNNILLTRQYQTDITSCHWRELFKHSVTLYGNANGPKDSLSFKILILKAIYELLTHGCRQSHLSLHLGEIFPFLDKIFKDAKRHSRVFSEDAFKTSNIICEKIGPESRMAVCEFGERVIQDAIYLKQSSAKYDWMLLIVRAHHPGGVTRGNEAAYAHNWNKWTEILRSIYSMILKDFKSDISSDSVIQLACEVSWQLEDENPSNESDYVPPSKRRKIVIGIQGMIDALTADPAATHQGSEHKLSVQILIALVTKYPGSIKGSNFRTIIKFLFGDLESCKYEKILDKLWELPRVMIELDTERLSSSVDNETKTWNQIWNIALRSAGIKRVNEQLHKFLQSFIKYRKVIDSDAILNLYLNNTIGWSKPSVQTLLIFCKHKAVPEHLRRSTNDNRWQKSSDQKPVKFRLLQWALKIPPGEWDAQFPVEDTCELLLDLTLKSWHNVDQITNSEILRQERSKRRPYSESGAKKFSVRKNLSCNLTNMEYIHLLTAFENNLYDEAVADENLLHSDEVRVDNVLYMEENRDLLIQNLFKENSKTKQSKLPINGRVVRIAVVAKIISNLEQLNMGQQNVKETLGAVVKNLTEEISTLIVKIVNSETNSEDKLELNDLKLATLDALCLLYKTRYRSDVVSIIQSSTEPNMLKNILELTTVSNERDEDESSNESDIRIKSCTLLVLFCGMVNAEEKIFDTSENLRQTLLDTKRYDLRQEHDLKMATIVSESLIDCELVSFSKNVTIGLANLLRELVFIWRKDAEAAKELLNILSKFLVRMGHDGNKKEKQNSISELNLFHKMIQENETGSMVYITFIECLETIARIDPLFIWEKWNDSEKSETRVVDDILSYIKNPLYEVRFRAIRFLQTIFISNNVKPEWLEDVFSKLESMTNDLFVVTEGTRENDDESRNQIASALHIMAVVIYSNAVLRSKALLSIFKLSVDKKIADNYVKRIIGKISVSLKIEGENSLVKNYLNYLLTHWLEERGSLDAFPFKLTGCTSKKKFHREYNAVILPIVVRKKGLENARDLCNEYEISFKKAIEDCLPHLISWLLPHLSSDPKTPPPGIDSNDIERAYKVSDTLNKRENELRELEEIAVSVNSNLQSVVLTIIKRLHDEQYSTQSLGIQVNYPCSDPPHFKQEDINRSFAYLENKFIENSNSLLYSLATMKQDVLQKVLLNLKCTIHKANYDEYKLKALHQYAYFSMKIATEMKEDYFDEIAAFVVRDICHTLIHFVKESSSSVSQAACSYLFHFLKEILPRRCKEIQHDYRLVMNSITSIVEAGRTGHACDIMELLAEHDDVLKDAIGKLASFPENAVFDKVRQVQSNSKSKTERSKSLENEIDHFLKSRDENTDNCSVTELQYLSNELSAKKEELKNMYQKLESVQRFSEDCTSSLLHQLICALVKLTASSDPDISLTAAECLGELGPADLSTIILQPEKYQRKQFSDPMLICTYRILILLSNFLTHSDIKLFTETSEALYTIMSSSWGQKISDKGQPKELKDETSQQLEDNTSQEFLRIEHIRPFIAEPTEANDKDEPMIPTIDEIKFNYCTDENSEIWTGESNTSHRKWVTNITCKILNCFSDSYLKQLRPVCEVNESFCEKILPWIIHLIVHKKKEFASRIYDSINRFFKFHFNDMNGSELEKYSPIESDEHKIKCFKSKSVRCMLNVVDFIRSQTLDQCLEFNYLDMAKAAQYCSAYFTSVLYVELWCESLLREWQRIGGSTPIDYICDSKPEKGKVLQEILKEAYIKIGDPDAIYGYGTSYFENPSAKIEHYAQCNRWDEVMLAYDIDLSLGIKTDTKGLLDTLQHSGLQYLLSASVSGINNREQDADINHQFECAWRLSNWNMPLSQLPINSQDSLVRFQNPVINDYSLYRYQTLKSFHERDEGGFKTALKRARNNAVKTLRNISLESCKTVYPVLSQLQMLREIEEIYFADPENFDSIIEKWKIQDSIGVNDFQYIEPILSQRAVCLLNNDKRKFDDNFLIDAYLRLAKSSQDHGYFQVTARALASLLKRGNLPPFQTLEILQYQEAILASMNGNHDLGRRLLRNLIVKKPLNQEIRAQALTTYGNWMAESKSENPQTIIKEYYQASLECSEKIKNEKTMLDTRAALAQFADLQFQRLITHMKSRPFEGLKEWSDHTEEAAEKLSKRPDVKKSRIAKLRSQSSIDKVKEENIKTEKDKFLLLAVENYILTLEQGNDYDLLVFKLVSLWLANAEHEELTDLLGKHLEKLPTHKFIISVPQLAPHMNEPGNKFSKQISRLLERCALDHPHHTLPVLLSLMNSHKDEDFLASEKSPREPRVLAAKKLIDNLKKTKTEIFLIIQEMEGLAHSLIEFANFKTDNKPGQFSIPKSQSILRCKKLERVLVPTLSIDVRPDARYDQIIGVSKYADSYDIIGGATVPKKITCLDTTGKKRYQLIKGGDDLRQDAVMQQVFTVMNTLLRTSKEAMKRKLRVRTYKVAPLSKRSGILEWCDNTVPIGKVLEGPKGLHAKYYKDDWTTSKCEEKMKENSECSKDKRIKVYMDCCEHLHPVFHYFFLESFPSPEIWFERRLSYTRSIATTSIISYILGLGDRHLDNILIEKSSGELIHIDFGIAFDQGKTKKFPETVPFRLSRDIEAAMGASGVEGVLRRSCEETLTVLRQHRGVIITLLQVLLCDPISSWEIMPREDNSKSLKVPEKSNQLADGALTQLGQKLEEIEKGLPLNLAEQVRKLIQEARDPLNLSRKKNKLAERALLQLEQKLQGIEEGSPYSVAGQVEKLIQEARDPVNLALSYYKQQPYL